MPDGEGEVITGPEGVLSQRPNGGAEGNHELATAELADMKHSVKVNMRGSPPSVRVSSSYLKYEEDRAVRVKKISDGTYTYFETVFFPKEWFLVSAVIDRNRAFLANDLLRSQYITAAKAVTFNIRRPEYLILWGIRDRDVLDALRGPESLLPGYDYCSSSVPVYAAGFWSSSYGKWISRVLNDFDFVEDGIKWHDASSNSIRIKVFSNWFPS